MKKYRGEGFPLNRRSFLIGSAAAALAPAAARAFEVPETPRLLHRDYARVRKGFRTRLLQKGPAPDKYESLDPPEGAQRLFYRSGYGGELELTAWVSKYKRGPKRMPAVLFLHGGNALGHGHWRDMKTYVEAGFIVMMPSMRGENGQKGNFSGFYDEVDDVLSAAERLRHLPGVDRDRLFLAGHSVGGTLAMLGAMCSQNFKACAPMSGNPDAFRFFQRYPEDIRFDDDNPHEFEVRSALCYAQSFKCPVRITHGSEEVHFQDRSDLLVTRAKAGGVKIESAIVKGGHTSALPEEIAQSIRFFKA